MTTRAPHKNRSSSASSSSERVSSRERQFQTEWARVATDRDEHSENPRLDLACTEQTWSASNQRCVLGNPTGPSLSALAVSHCQGLTLALTLPDTLFLSLSLSLSPSRRRSEPAQERASTESREGVEGSRRRR
eukprot:1292861-Rhodomonas_salina.1